MTMTIESSPSAPPVAAGMSADDATVAALATAIDEHEQIGRAGSTARMAVLLYMAKQPAGAEFEQLQPIIDAACGRTVPPKRITQVLMAMRADGQLVRERRPQGPGQPEVWRWYSPASRQAAAVRGTWRPPADTQADAAATQAAGAIARARGLATDPTAD